MAFIVDASLFHAEGALLNWSVVARRLGILSMGVVADRLPRVLQLRWTLKDSLGLPTEPFLVWRRNKKRRPLQPLTPSVSPFGVFFGGELLDLEGSYSVVELNVSGGGGVVYAFLGNPWISNVVAVASMPSGNNISITLVAPAMEGLVLPSGTSINSIQGARTDTLSAADGWERYELVGLPVKQSQWEGQGVGRHGRDQGILSALVDAMTAAGQRLERGAPPVGWGPFIEAGLPAPAWMPPKFAPLLAELNAHMLDDLRGVAMMPPNQQSLAKINKFIPPPENSSGQAMNEPGTTSTVRPLISVYTAAAVDCFNSLGLGFGTAYPVVSGNTDSTALDYDYMITARFERGADGQSAPLEYAAIVPAPAAALPPPLPSNLAQQQMGNLRPLARDLNWLGSVRVSWDRPVPVPLFRPRSFAFAQAGDTPAFLVMNRRRDGSPIPIALNYFTSPEDPEPNRVSAVARELPIPNNPGTRALKYGVAHQDIFGQWSAWSAVAATLAQPPVDEPRIVSAQFVFHQVPSPPATKCHADLVLEFLWDWRIRTPQTISFRGRLFAAAYHGAPPPDTTLPSGLQTALAVAPSTSFTARFDLLAANGAPTSSWPGFNPLTHATALNPAGDQIVAFGNAQGPESRRYRVTIPGFELDFAATGHIGLALWGQGQEALVPQHVSTWSARPSVVSTSDPRPPLIVPDIVTLASLPDAAGSAHAVLKWSGSSGADGYFVYETSETKLRKAVGQAEPDPALTLSERFTALKTIFNADPAGRRTEFTRRNSRLITGTSTDVTLPRGSTAIHLYVVLGVSAGQVEAPWPATADALYAFSAPRVPQPAAPTIEVSAFVDAGVTPPVYRSRIRIRTRKGPRVRRIDLHRVRVDDAARDLDTMGPPVATLEAPTTAWQIDEATDALGPTITHATGVDTPSGSWKRVWYRAVAWSAKDAARGILATRSPASSSAWVVIPPSEPPDLSPIAKEWPGTAPADVLLTWSSAAMIRNTPLGPHTIAVSVTTVGADSQDPPLISTDRPLGLAEIATTPPSAAVSGIWRVDGSKPAQYRAMIIRADVNDALDVRVRITDPLGRSSEQLLTVPAGAVLAPPDLSELGRQPSVAPPGVMIAFTSRTSLDVPLYQLKIAVIRPPRPGRFPLPQPPILLESPLASVPLDEPGPVPPGSDPVRVRRLPGSGPLHRYYAFVRVPFRRVVVTLTAPDGRTVQRDILPS